MSPNDWPTGRPLVADTNTILSALVGETTRKLILELERELYYPEQSYEEIGRNLGVIQERSGLSPTRIDTLLETIFKNISLVPESVVARCIETAELARSPHPDANPKRTFLQRDENDVVFLAAAVAISGDIWSDDGVYKHQELVSWYRTGDVVELSGVSI